MTSEMMFVGEQKNHKVTDVKEAIFTKSLKKGQLHFLP